MRLKRIVFSCRCGCSATSLTLLLQVPSGQDKFRRVSKPGTHDGRAPVMSVAWARAIIERPLDVCHGGLIGLMGMIGGVAISLALAWRLTWVDGASSFRADAWAISHHWIVSLHRYVSLLYFTMEWLFNFLEFCSISCHFVP